MMAMQISDTEIEEILDAVSALDSSNSHLRKRVSIEVSFWRDFWSPFTIDFWIVAEYQGSVELCSRSFDKGDYYSTRKSFRDKADLEMWLKKAQAKGQKKANQKMSEPMKNVLWKHRWS